MAAKSHGISKCVIGLHYKTSLTLYLQIGCDDPREVAVSEEGEGVAIAHLEGGMGRRVERWRRMRRWATSDLDDIVMVEVGESLATMAPPVPAPAPRALHTLLSFTKKEKTKPKKIGQARKSQG